MTQAQTRTGNDPQPGPGSAQNASPRSREIQRRLLLALPRLMGFDQRRREFMRRLRGAPHQIDFFHQVDDPYSALAIQAIAELKKRYRVEFRFHLVSQTDRLHAPEPELLSAYARRDCAWVAPHYGLAFPKDATHPARDQIQRVEGLLAGLTEDPRFLDVAIETAHALWKGNDASLRSLEERIRIPSEEETLRKIEAGNALRKRRFHYSGAMFWYAGEWYWGVDRLHHLERRLDRLGATRASAQDGGAPRFDRPPIDPGAIRNEGRLELEIFPSLRSPYTAVILDRSLKLAEAVDVPVTLRPVMPMVMRGVPAPAAKGIYIMVDAIREARHIGEPFGNMFDPIGAAVERGFSLWPFARDRGKGEAFLVEFLRAAFVEGRPTGTDEGLRRVVERAGLSFDEARAHLDSDAWRTELEANRQLMYEELGLWGVPSYRLRGPKGGAEGEPDLCVWGQDRLWLVAAEIRRRLAAPRTTLDDSREASPAD